MLQAAVEGGADAVYLGLQSFNARRNAENFGFASLEKACRYAHLRGVRIYVAMNTIVFEDELESAIDTAKRAWDIGADAFIVQDIGLAVALFRNIEAVRLHASTQMSIHSVSGLQMAADIGFSRVTLAREMSLGEISNICKEAKRLGIEVETFVHGALCISYSGQCLMSSMIGCRSANRGLCAQPCRLEYELVDTRDPSSAVKAAGNHLLSPKDLCSIDDIDLLVSMGVSSLKIEGRMKSAEYAHSVVGVYRHQLDSAFLADLDDELCAVPRNSDSCAKFADLANSEVSGGLGNSATIADSTKSAKDKLESVFSRGLSSAYLEGNRGNSMMSYQRPNNRGQFVGRVKAVHDDIFEISLEQQLKAGDKCEIWTRRGNIILNITSDSDPSKKVFAARMEDVQSSNRLGQQDTPRPGKADRVFRVRSADAQVKLSAFEPRVAVNGSFIAHLGKPLCMSFSLAYVDDAVSRRLRERLGGKLVSAHFEGDIVEAARTKSITPCEVREHIDRMGQTPFRLANLDIELDEGVGMGFSQIHHARSSALSLLEDAIIDALGYRQNFESATASKSKKRRLRKGAPEPCGRKDVAIATRAGEESRAHKAFASEDISVCVYVSNPECGRVAKRNGADVIYVNALNYRRTMSQMCGVSSDECAQAGYPKHCVQVMGSISHDMVGRSREAILQTESWASVSEGSTVVVGSIDNLRRAEKLSCEIEIGPELPLANSESFEFASALGARCVWLSSELSLAQIEELSASVEAESLKNVRLGISILGAQELMTCEHCVLMSIGKCDEACPSCSRRKVPFVLKDRLGYKFPVVSDYLGRSHIFNSLSTDNTNSIPSLIDAGVSSFMIDARLMNPERTAQETSRLRSALELALSGSKDIERRKGTTTGHLHRPVE